jgi:hypothetical protein
MPRRRRGGSIAHYVYLGTHPVALVMSLMLTMIVMCAVAGWVAVVGAGWLLWVAGVTVIWACGGLRGTPRRRMPAPRRR